MSKRTFLARIFRGNTFQAYTLAGGVEYSSSSSSMTSTSSSSSLSSSSSSSPSSSGSSSSLSSVSSSSLSSASSSSSLSSSTSSSSFWHHFGGMTFRVRVKAKLAGHVTVRPHDMTFDVSTKPKLAGRLAVQPMLAAGVSVRAKLSDTVRIIAP